MKGGEQVTQTELARQLGISGGYLWKIYNGYAIPSERMARRIKPATGKTASWWSKARLAEIQKLFDRLMEA
jgi:transcriptional regulator with XRE-family HTH domain